jgi:hypothetical protein
MRSGGGGPFIAHSSIAMLTTKEVLEELRRLGVKDRNSLRAYLKDFEDYMITHYGVKILHTKRKTGTLRGQKHTPATQENCPAITSKSMLLCCGNSSTATQQRCPKLDGQDGY